MDLLTPSFGLIIWTLVAFLVVFFILKKYAWKPILNSLGEREKNISDALLSTEKIKREMESLKNENEILLVKAREERSK
jgi:F-type H+-transporting ATPase subunit b